MIFAPKIASIVDVLMRRSARRSYGGTARFVLNVAGETLFTMALAPVMALTHTVFLFRLLLLRRGGTWNSQMRESHAVPWRLACSWHRPWPASPHRRRRHQDTDRHRLRSWVLQPGLRPLRRGPSPWVGTLHADRRRPHPKSAAGHAAPLRMPAIAASAADARPCTAP